MISYIRGELAETAADHVVIDVNGIGFTVYVPGLVFGTLPAIGESVRLHTYFQVREDSFLLYGFPDKDSLELFRLLIGVSGIGPKGGLAILSTMPADELRFAILSGDAKSITKAPGIGAKTAQRLILDLKDKVDLEEAFESKLEHVAGGVGSNPAAQVQKDAIDALVALGYSQTESLKAVTKVELTGEMSVEDVLKGALKHMALGM